ncbi:hypothetical protein KEM55_006729 [Ascosphaera atra]|nr:hypothetical protein KEM55_006729 [Ascosphaera atra]
MPPLPDNHPEKTKYVRAKLAKVDAKDHTLYWDTKPPTDAQLKWADSFFRSTLHTSKKLEPSRSYHQLAQPEVPELVFMGISHGEKRLTLNWIFEQYLATTSATPGRKHKLQPYALGWKKWKDFMAVIVDTPGLGSKNQEERAQMFSRYLLKRRRPYVFLNMNAQTGPRQQDSECLGRLQRFGIPHQVVLCRADHVLRGSYGNNKTARITHPFTPEGFELLQRRMHEIKELVQPKDLPETHRPGLGEIITYSTDTDNAFGISHLRWAVLKAAGLDKLYEKDFEFHKRYAAENSESS